MRKKTRYIKTMVLGVGMGIASLASASMSFTALGDLPGGLGSYAEAVSGDGQTVVGRSRYTNFGLFSTYYEAFRWTKSEGLVGLGDFTGGNFNSSATGASFDGSVVVGSGSSTNFGTEVCQWNVSNVITGLGFWASKELFSFYDPPVLDVSDNGLVISGTSEITNSVAFKWTETGGAPVFMPHEASFDASYGTGISGDGSIVVGYVTIIRDDIGESFDDQAFRWTESGGVEVLGDLLGETFESQASGISGDGSVVIGRINEYGNEYNPWEAFRWTQSGGIEGLGDLPGGDSRSEAYAVSYDGSVIVGSSYTDRGSEAFVWHAATGMRSLQSLLESGGVDLSGWRLYEATGISDDGKTICGTGLNPSGTSEAFVATITLPITISTTGSQVQVGFNTETGLCYEVWAATDLQNPLWFGPLYATVGSNTWHNSVLSMEGLDQRFYQVRTMDLAPEESDFMDLVVGTTIPNTSWHITSTNAFLWNGSEPGLWSYTKLDRDSVLLVFTYDEDGNNPAVFREEALLSYLGKDTGVFDYALYVNNSEVVSNQASGPFTFETSEFGLAPTESEFTADVVGTMIPNTAYQILAATTFVRSGDAGLWSYTKTGDATATLVFTYDSDGNDPGVFREEILLTYTGEGSGTFRASEYVNGAEVYDSIEFGPFTY